MEPGLNMPAQLGPQDIGALSLLLPDGAHLTLEPPGTLVLDFFGHGSRKKIFSFEIGLDRKPDFSGDTLSLLVKDLAGTAAARYRSLERSAMPIHEKVAAVVVDTVDAVRKRRTGSGDYSLALRTVHTMEPRDWY